jgi:hypothetical protein
MEETTNPQKLHGTTGKYARETIQASLGTGLVAYLDKCDEGCWLCSCAVSKSSSNRGHDVATTTGRSGKDSASVELWGSLKYWYAVPLSHPGIKLGAQANEAASWAASCV